MKIQVHVLAWTKCRRIVIQYCRDITDGLRRYRIRREMCAIAGEIAGVSRSHQRARDKLRRASTRHEIRQNFVVSRLWQSHIYRPLTVGLLFRMDMLEVLHILADDEQVILPLLDYFI